MSYQEKKRRVVSMDSILGVETKTADNEKHPTSKIDEYLDDIEALELRELKQLKLRSLIEQEKKKLANILDGEDINSSTNVRNGRDNGLNLSLEDVRKLSELDEEKKNAVLATYAAIKAAEKSSGDNIGGVLPLLLAYGQTHGTNDIAKFGEVIVNAIQTGMQMNAPPEEGTQNVKDQLLLKAFEKLTEKAPSGGDGGKDALTLIKELKELGLIKLPTEEKPSAIATEEQRLQSDRTINLELMKLNKQTELELKKLEKEFQLEMAKLNLEKAKSDAITSGILRLANAAGRALAQGEIQTLQETGAEPLVATNTEAEIVHQPCPNCGKDIAIPEPSKARQITCPYCNASLDWTPTTV